jgi:hypothetical protein
MSAVQQARGRLNKQPSGLNINVLLGRAAALSAELAYERG